MKRWKPETVMIVLTLVLAAFAGGYFTGRATVAPGAAAVLTQRTPPAQAEETPDAAPDPAPPAPETTVAAGEGTGARIDLNTADAAALATLPGIGEALAARIVAYREENGPFASVEELTEVNGIGAKKLAAVEALVSVGE